MTHKNIYLDHNATTPIKPVVYEFMKDNFDFYGNASSVHKIGREAKKKIEQARSEISSFVNSSTRATIVFTSGATEANNTILKGSGCDRTLVSAIEHASVMNAIKNKEIIPVLPDGVIDLKALNEMLESNNRSTLISVMMVNNETGVIQPIKEIVEIAKKYGALVHTDAVQAAGRINIDIKELGVDFLTLSSHKMGGPQGVGCIVLSGCSSITPLIYGGGQEKKIRAGTENILGIIGFGKAASISNKSISDYKKLVQLRDKIEKDLENINPDIKFWGKNAPRVANTTLFSIPEISGETQLIALDLDGICISNGSACSSGTVNSSYVLKAMRASDAEANSAIRVSLGWNSNKKDVEYFISKWTKIYNRIKSRINS